MASARHPGIGGRVSATELQQEVQKAGLALLSASALKQFETYLDLILKWNARLNLTAIREPHEILRRHFLESIQCAQALPEGANFDSLLDFGSGAGLPGVPIAILKPELRVILAESQRKKAAFLREVVRSLNLNAEVFDGRVETMPEDRPFPLITLRAVDNMQAACQEASKRLGPEGWLVIFTTAKGEAGLRAALPQIHWQRQVQISGLNNAILLFGQNAV